MTLAFDASSSLSFTGDNSWTHTPVGTPRAVKVYIIQNNQTTDQILGVTYGGVTMTEVAGSPFVQDQNASAEPGVIYEYFLGANIPTGAQTVAVDTSNTAAKRGVALTYTSDANKDTVVEDTSVVGGTTANPTVDLTTGAGVNTAVSYAIHSGQDAVGSITPGTGFTSVIEFDFGTQTCGIRRKDANGTGGTVSCNETSTADEWGLFATAIREVADTIVSLGQVVETEAAQAMTVEKDVAVTQAVETEAAVGMTVELGVAVGQVLETEAAQAMAAEKDVALSQVVETETAQPMVLGPLTVTYPLGQVVETEAAQAFTPERQVPVGQVTETEAAVGMSMAKAITLGQVVETEQAQPMGVSVSGASPVGDVTGEARNTTSFQTTGILGVAAVGDLIELFVLVSSTTPVVSATGLGGASYTVRTTVLNSSMQLNHLTRIAGASEPEATINLSVSSNAAVAGQLIRSSNGFDAADTTATSLGTDTSIVLPNQVVSTPGSVLLVGYGFRKGSVPDFTLAQASNHEELSEADSDDLGGSTNYSVSCSIRNTGGAYGRNAGTYGGETFTTDAGTHTGRQALIHVVIKSATGTTSVPVTQVIETEQAQSMGMAWAPTLAQVSEVESAQPISPVKEVALGQVVETETAMPMSFSGVTINVPLGQVTELEAALPMSPTRYVTLNQVVEVEVANAVSVVGQSAFLPGLWRNKPSDTGTWRQKLNRDRLIFGEYPGPWSYYLNNGTALPAEVVTAYNEGHTILLYSKVGQAGNWASIASGAQDAAINTLANSIIANISPTNPIIFTWWHEPENDSAQGSPADYVAAYNRVRTRFIAQGVGTRVRWQMTFMNSHAHAAGTMEGFWPGNWVQITSQQSYISCGATTNIATKHLEDFQYLRDNRSAARKWSDLDNNDTDGKRVELAVSEYGMDLGGDLADCGVEISPGVIGDIGTPAHRALGFDRIRAQLQAYVDYNVKYLTLFNARTDAISTETNTSTDGAAYQLLIDAMKALSEVPDQLHVLGLAFETEAAQPVEVTKYVQLGQVVELEVAQPFTGQQGVTQTHLLGQVVELEQAQPMEMQSTGPGPVEVIPVEAPDYTFHIDPPDYTFWAPAPDWDLEE